MDLSTARLADFVRWIGTEFRVTDMKGGPIALELVEAKPLPAQQGSRSPEPFSLTFRGPQNRPLDARFYSLEHLRIGWLSLLLFPIGPGFDARGTYYRATFR